jgi:hypothetical protein
MAGFMVSNSNILLCTKPISKVQTADSSMAEVWRKEQLVKIIEGYNTNLATFTMLMRLGCSSGSHLTRHWVLKKIHAMVEEFHGEGNSSVSLKCQ